MKKKIMLFLCAFLCVNKVCAKTIYTDYNFVGYTNDVKENDEVYKYESVRLNKFYKEEETSVVYAPYGTFVDGAPYVDESDTKIGRYYLGSKSEFGDFKHNIIIKTNDVLKVNTININRLSTWKCYLYEIEVYNKDKLLGVTVGEYSELADGVLDKGATYDKKDVIIKLDDYYDINDLSIIFYYNNPYTNSIYFDISLMGEDAQISNTIYLDRYVGGGKTSKIRFLPSVDYNRFVLENNILPEEYVYENTLREYYEYEITLYKHYNLEKKYYMESLDNEIDGYQYDSSESVSVYKVYKRDKIEIEDEINEDADKKVSVPKKTSTTNTIRSTSTSTTTTTKSSNLLAYNDLSVSKNNYVKAKNVDKVCIDINILIVIILILILFRILIILIKKIRRCIS